jgi:hypothetical protein
MEKDIMPRARKTKRKRQPSVTARDESITYEKVAIHEPGAPPRTVVLRVRKTLSGPRTITFPVYYRKTEPRTFALPVQYKGER